MSQSARGMAFTTDEYDAVVVGSGPNGLAAGIVLAQAGHTVLLLESKDTIGGGTRTQELTAPGFFHDVCSAVHPMGVASPFLRSLPLADHGLNWIHSPIPMAHPLADGRAAMLCRSLDATVDSLGSDGRAYRRLMQTLVDQADHLVQDLVGPMKWPKYPLLGVNFGLNALRSAVALATSRFSDETTRALWGGLAAHSVLPLSKVSSSAIALMLGVAGHAYGWPIAAGGSRRITDAMAAHFINLGGQIRTNHHVQRRDDLPKSRVVLFDLTPRQILAIEGLAMPNLYRRRLARYRYGPGVFKIDWALKEPIPWSAPACRQAATVHVGGTLAQIARAEQAAWSGAANPAPFVLLTQPSLFDPSRAPAGMHTAWGYCHVPHHSTTDMTAAIESQIERFAPGFRDVILQRRTMSPELLEAYNANYIGGDIVGGVTDLGQLLTRPIASLNPYRIPGTAMYLCSSSTPPGAGVHGLCGFYAATAALKQLV